MYRKPLQVQLGKLEIVTSYNSFEIEPKVITVKTTPSPGSDTIIDFKIVHSMALKDSIFK